MLLQSLGSLGSLLTTSNDYDTAEKYLNEYLDIVPKGKYSVILNGHIDLVKLYIKKEDYQNANKFNERALEIADSIQSTDLKIDLFVNKCIIFTKLKDFDLAYQAYEEGNKLASQIGNPYYIKNCKSVYASLLHEQKKYRKALTLYQELIEEEKSGENVMQNLMEYYGKLSEIEQALGNYQSSLRYLKLENEISDSLDLDKQKQLSAYLKIKFEAEEKQRENLELSAKVSASQSQRKLLLAIIIAGFLGSIFLAFGFFQKRTFNKRLKEDVASRTKDLENANEELSEFNKIFSHDLKEPLRSIVGFSALAQKEYGSGNSVKMNEYLTFVNKSGLQMHQLIEDVSSFQTLDVCLNSIKENTDCNEVIAKIEEANRSLIDERNVVIKYKDLPTITSNESILFLIFKNLIENAIKFNESPNPLITIEGKKEKDFQHFYISDNGIGIPAKFHKSIFHMFERLNDRGSYEGTGLGLSIVKKLLSKLGGTISIDRSELNVGTTFKISMPAG